MTLSPERLKEVRHQSYLKRLAKKPLKQVLASLQYTEDEMYAYDAFLFINCKTDDDYEKPEYSLESFREMVRNFVISKRRKLETWEA